MTNIHTKGVAVEYLTYYIIYCRTYAVSLPWDNLFLKKNFFVGPLMPLFWTFGDVCRTSSLGFRATVDLSHACLIDCAMVSVDSPLSASPNDPLMTSMSADPFVHLLFHAEVGFEL